MIGRGGETEQERERSPFTGKQFNSIQVNEKFHKLERVYRDCIKRTRDKTRIIQYTARCTRRLMHSDQTRKYGISESMLVPVSYKT